jgi:hypothetical protein
MYIHIKWKYITVVYINIREGTIKNGQCRHRIHWAQDTKKVKQNENPTGETKKMSNMHMDPTKKTVNPGSHESPGKTNI